MRPDSFLRHRDDVLARFRCLVGQEAPPSAPVWADTAGRLPADFRSFYVCRAGGATFSSTHFAEIVNDDLITPLEHLVTGTASALAEAGLPAGWRADEEAQGIVAASRRAAGATHESLISGRVEEAADVLVTTFHALTGRVGAGPAAAALRDALRRLLPLLGCVTPSTSVRAWTLLGIRGRPAERLADGSLVDEPAPPRPEERLFPGGPIDPFAMAGWKEVD